MLFSFFALVVAVNAALPLCVIPGDGGPRATLGMGQTKQFGNYRITCKANFLGSPNKVSCPFGNIANRQELEGAFPSCEPTWKATPYTPQLTTLYSFPSAKDYPEESGMCQLCWREGLCTDPYSKPTDEQLRNPPKKVPNPTK